MNSAVFQERKLIGLEANGDAAHQAGLERLPDFIEPIFQIARLGDLWNARLKGNARVCGLAELGLADWLARIVLPSNGSGFLT